jgi:hypothetical protein
MASSVPKFLRYATVGQVVLVWGQRAMEAVERSHLRLQTLRFPPHPLFRVVLFGADPATASLLYDNATPTLVVDAAALGVEHLPVLQRAGRTIWAMNLPFWTHVATANGNDPVALRPLLVGSTVVPERSTTQRERDALLQTLIDATAPPEPLCASCFAVANGTAVTGGCGHRLCLACSVDDIVCYHPSHRRDPFQRVAEHGVEAPPSPPPARCDGCDGALLLSFGVDDCDACDAQFCSAECRDVHFCYG